MRMVALIPARAGSKRIPGKNTSRLLGGQLLVYWTMRAAYDSNVFSDIQLWTDSAELHMTCAERWPMRSFVRAPSTDDEPDIAWVKVWAAKGEADAFAILRPTSPFRTAATIRRAYDQFKRSEVHSIRAVQPVKEHPGKMWQCAYPGYPIVPLIGKTWPANAPGAVGLDTKDDRPWHSLPTQTLPQVYVQNASLEMAWSYVIPAFGTISGRKIAPFFTDGYEGFDLNTMDDWRGAERLIEEGLVELPSLPLARV